ncbi:MAG: hypothetical protein KJ749_07000 [Planctomycetes bacterium]|nr:hypothetical protein [Planctomycetota bacterium]
MSSPQSTLFLRFAQPISPPCPPAEEFSTLAPELARELLHHSDNGERPPKSGRETEAKAVAPEGDNVCHCS